MNKRASVMDLVLQPLFVTIVALGIVLLMILSSIYDIQSSTAYEKKFYSADIALLIDSLFALPKDTNLEMEYIFPADFGMTAEHNTVTILPDEGQNFHFTDDSLYNLVTTSFQPSKSATQLLFYKAGNTVGVDNRKTFSPNLDSQYCEYAEPRKLKAIVDYRATIGPTPTLVVTGEALLSARLNPGGETIAKIYINPLSESEQIACLLSREIIEIGINTAIIPVNTQLLAADDPRNMLKGATPALFVDIYGTPDASKAKILQAIKKGVSTYGLA